MGHLKWNPLFCIAWNGFPKRAFIDFYSDNRGILQSQVYLIPFTDSYRHLILCNIIS